MKILNNFRFFKNSFDHNRELYIKNKISIFLLIVTFFTFLSISGYAQSWLSDYSYRRALTINNSGALATDYQVRIQLNSSNFNNHFPQANGEDFRLTADDGTTLLPFWIESWSSNQGVIWTKVPSVPNGSATIYIYYGNNSATSLSNGNSTFDFFEDNWVINPVIRSSQPSWEVSITYPMVFKEGSTYNMIYDGHGFNEAKGLATSTDLINWTPYANNPVIGFDKNGVDRGGNGQYAWGDIIKVGSTYNLFPSQGPGTTVRATSTDLINWTGFTTLTTNDPGGIGSGAAILKDGDGVTPVQVGGFYWMVYSHGATPGALYMAFSIDLNHWFNANNNNPFLTGTSSGWDSTLFSPSFIKVGSTYYVYYQGYKSNTNWQIGFASAPATGNPNTVSWTKYAGNPVISGNHGWDNPIAIDPEFRKFDDTYYLFYTGGGGSNGFATSVNPEGPWTQNNNDWVRGFPVTGNIPIVSNGIISINANQFIQTRSTYSNSSAVGFRGNFKNDFSGYKWAGFIAGESAPFLTYQVDAAHSELTFIALEDLLVNGGHKTETNVGTAALTGFHNFEIGWTSNYGIAIIDGSYESFIFPPSLPAGPLPINFSNLNNANTTFDVDWVYKRKFIFPDPAVTVGAEQSAGVTVNAKVYLEGPYSGGGLMTTTLNTNTLIPLNSNTAYSTATYGYTASTVGSIPNATIVDWVLVELRTGTAAGTKVVTRAAFLKSDGTIVDIDGTSPVSFNSVSAGNYYVVVRHRNHLAIMTANAIALSGSSALYDFSTAQTQAYGTNPMKALTGGGFGLYAGDANADGFITSTDFNVFNPKFTSAASGYEASDWNLDRFVTSTDFNYFNPNFTTAKQSFVP